VELAPLLESRFERRGRGKIYKSRLGQDERPAAFQLSTQL